MVKPVNIIQFMDNGSRTSGDILNKSKVTSSKDAFLMFQAFGLPLNHHRERYQKRTICYSDQIYSYVSRLQKYLSLITPGPLRPETVLSVHYTETIRLSFKIFGLAIMTLQL